MKQGLYIQRNGFVIILLLVFFFDRISDLLKREKVLFKLLYSICIVGNSPSPVTPR